MKEADVNAVVEVADQLPAEARAVRRKTAKKSTGTVAKTAGTVAKTAGTGAKTARTVLFDEDELFRAEEKPGKRAGADEKPEKRAGAGEKIARSGKKRGGTGEKSAKAGAKKAKGRAKARSGSEKLTPAALYRKMIAFGKVYQVEREQDFIEAARIYAEEAGLIDQMRDRIAEDGLTVEKTYKTGSVEVAHPLLSELPRHVESANKCLATIGNMIGERGARVEKAARDLDAFRLH